MFGPEIPPIRRGQKIRASWLMMLRAAVLRALSLRVEPPLELIDLNGVRVLRLAASTPAGGLFGQITTACPARTGAAPNFTYGKGAALLYTVSVSGSGVATTSSTGRTVDVYNYLNIIIPVRSVPVALEYRDGILCVDGGDCI